MPVFLYEPRYRFGCLGFYTQPSWGRRVVLAGVFLTSVGILSVVVGALFLDRDNAMASLFLMGVAWVLMFGLMRLFCTGAMWMLSVAFDAVSEGFPSAAPAMHTLERVYWILLEVFLSLGFLWLLVSAVLVATGVISMRYG